MQRLFFALIVVTVFLSLFRLGSVSLFDVDEAVFATATKEMVQSGDWITPTYNGENRYDKPIFFYWLMAISYALFGINEFGARFPSAFAGFLLVVCSYLFVRRVRDERSALYAALSLSLSVYFFLYSHAAVTDMTLTLFTALSLMSFYLSLPVGDATGRETFGSGNEHPEKSSLERGVSRNATYYLCGFYFFSALAFLTKGLIGILFPFGIAVVFMLVTEGTGGVRRIFSPVGIVLFLVVSAPWYVAQVMINGREFIGQFFLKHHLMRYTGVISGHRGPLYYYVPALIVGLFPWIAFLPAGIRRAFRERDRLLLFASVWTAFVVLFFSFSTTKLPNYILPAVPAVAILLSSGMSAEGRLVLYGHAFIAATAVVLGIALLMSGSYLVKLGITEKGWIGTAAAALLLVAAAGFYGFAGRKGRYGFLATASALFLIVLSVKALPLASTSMQGTLLEYSLYAKERLGEGDRLITYGINNPSIVFYSGHHVTGAGSPEEIRPYLAAGVNVIAIAKAKDAAILNEFGFHVVRRDGKYALLEKNI